MLPWPMDPWVLHAKSPIWFEAWGGIVATFGRDDSTSNLVHLLKLDSTRRQPVVSRFRADNLPSFRLDSGNSITGEAHSGCTADSVFVLALYPDPCATGGTSIDRIVTIIASTA